MGFKFKHIFKGVGKVIKPVNRILTPVLGAAIGSMLGGPAGGILGASLAGASMRGGHNRLNGALQGAAIGSAYQAFAPMVASSLGVNPATSPIISSMTGLNSPSLLHQLGMSSAPSIGGGLGLIGNMGQQGVLPNLTMGNVLGNGLGALQDISQYQPQIPHGPNLEFPEHGFPEEGFSGVMPGQSAFQQPGHQVFNVNTGMPRSRMSPLEVLMKMSPRIPFSKPVEHKVVKHDTEKKEEGKKGKKESLVKFAKGGLVKKERVGYIKESDSGGQDDDIDMDIAPNAYVMNGMDVSLLGDGNTENGVKRLKKWEDSFPKSGVTKFYDYSEYGSKPVKAKVSNGEYVLKPGTVAAIGKGDIKKGVKVIDKMRHNLRKHKGVKAILPPRTKPMNHYMKGGA